MKPVHITGVESFAVRIPPDGARDPLKIYNYGVTRVNTDAGVTGTSFLGCPAEILNRWVKPTLVGDDLFAVDRHLKRLQMERGESGVQAWSGVEHALWDAIGQAVAAKGDRFTELVLAIVRSETFQMRTPSPKGAGK